ncbi:hypothetical protein [Novosphingobium sp. RL4]|uniref:hypothetical protein n=1 Tax=Novosphingobium sp. RL4 TaxID=3109595 RepID=UPI002D782BFA|nr:hypothetical protein [Novosphingobium sp. RL4]WRT91336.1 hypothetical protein U9J33_08830 [Novosphingobium sp. RL4]
MIAPDRIPPHHAFPDVSWIDLQAELRRELARRREAFPAMVRKGQMTEQERQHQTDLFSALLEDAQRFQQAMAPLDQGKPCTNPLKLHKLHGYTWHQRRAAITRELDNRQRLYPLWIRKGQLTQRDADLFTRRLTCMRAIYELGYDWTPSNGARCHFASAAPSLAERDAREQWHIIETEIAARDGQAQEAMAL